MKYTKLTTLILAGVFGAFTASVQAEDIELFLQNPTATNDLSNVLFVVDASANWSSTLNSGGTKHAALHSALYSLLSSNDIVNSDGSAKLNVGLMMYSNAGGSTGGKVWWAVKPFSGVLDATELAKVDGVLGVTADYPSTNRGRLLDRILYSAADANNLKANSSAFGLTFHEAYLYFSGLAPRTGTDDGVFSLHATNSHSSNVLGYDADALNGSVYESPVDNSVCGKNVIIFIANGGPASGENNTSESLLTALGGVLDSDPIGLSPSNEEANWADEYARFLQTLDLSTNEGQQNIITYTLDISDTTDSSPAPARAVRSLLKSIAQQGGGAYKQATSASEIFDALTDILNEIQAVNSVFASTTLPVSVNVRGTNLNQVYMGVFRPDENAMPLWYGNLKMYKLGVDTSTTPAALFLADSTGARAENQVSGFIKEEAISFWTTDSTFWSYRADGAPSDSPDGAEVEKGGHAQQIREAFPSTYTGPYRYNRIYTCNTDCTGTNELLYQRPFYYDWNYDDFGNPYTPADSQYYNEWVRRVLWIAGYDTEDENGSGISFPTNGVPPDPRPSLHGDVLHSRPAVINYGRTGDDDDVVAYYGANDGIFHAVKGGEHATTIGSTTFQPGQELWGFIPTEFFDKLGLLFDNDVPVLSSLPGVTTQQKPYFFDGSIGVFQRDVNNDGKLVASDGDKIFLYVAMRRGGRGIYALDVSNPVAPKLKWHLNYDTDVGYNELGYTFSEPQVARVRGWPSQVLIFGAGYDQTANDAEPQDSATMGRGLYIIDALTGEIVRRFGPTAAGSNATAVSGMNYSIPSDVTMVNSDHDASEIIDYVYVGDTGGNIWRFDLTSFNPSNWAAAKMAEVDGGGDTPRKFLFPPDVVETKDDNGSSYLAVLAGSGDREHPFETDVSNAFFMFKDYTPYSGCTHPGDVDGNGDCQNHPITVDGISVSGGTILNLYDATDNTIQVGTAAEITAASTELAAASGWYLTLGTGEKVVGSAITLEGTTLFNTNQPAQQDSSSCVSDLGTARSYLVSFKDASSTQEINGVDGLTTADRYSELPGGGFPPSPVAVVVEIDGEVYQAVISGTNVITPETTTLGSRRRVFWYKVVD